MQQEDHPVSAMGSPLRRQQTLEAGLDVQGEEGGFGVEVELPRIIVAAHGRLLHSYRVAALCFGRCQPIFRSGV